MYDLLAQQAAEGVGREHRQVDRGLGHDGGAALLDPEERALAEEVAAVEARDRDHAGLPHARAGSRTRGPVVSGMGEGIENASKPRRLRGF